MKTLFLLRHAKSSWDDPLLDDFDRPLSKRGRRSAKAIADYLNHERIRPDQVLCSASRRTRETVDRLQRRLGRALPVRFERGLYLADAATLLNRLRRLPDGLASVMIVGHNPGLENLLTLLLDRSAGEAGVSHPDAYPTGALGLLRFDIDHWQDVHPESARLIAFIRPRDLLAIA